MASRKALIVAVAAVGLALAGCSSAPSQGVVKDMDSSPGMYIQQSHCYPSGKTTICTSVPIWIPASWSLDVWENPSDESKAHGWVDVDQNAWGRCHVGDTYTDGRCKHS